MSRAEHDSDPVRTLTGMEETTPRKYDPMDPFTLLCEKCGYVIEGLDQDGACPECGKPIGESLPERRVGTPWQQKPGAKSLVRTWWITIRHPAKIFDRMRIDGHNQGSMQLSAYLVASLIPFPLCFLMYLWIRDSMFQDVRFTTMVLTPLILPVVLPALTAIESKGLRIFSRRRGGRLDSVAAKTITAHGSVGWILLGFGLALSFGLFLLAIPFIIDTSGDFEKIASFFYKSGLYTLIGGPLIGFLFFEIFAYLGLRRCKYANRCRPSSPETT